MSEQLQQGQVPPSTGSGRRPDFLIVGSFKSGSTSLVSYLNQHPDVYLPWLQEPAFFASPRFSMERGGDPRPQRAPESAYGRLRAETIDQYEALFADAPPGAVCGESSPQYMREPEACDRIADVLPDVKLLAVLRQPASRAYSDFSMFVRDGLEKSTFAEAVARPPGRRPPFHYVETGFYGRQLAPFYERFGADRIKVVLFDDLTTRTAETVRDVYAWLGVDPGFEPDVSEVLNVAGRPTNALVAATYRVRRRLQPVLKPVVPQQLARSADRVLRRGLVKDAPDPAVMAALTERYADDIRLLARLSGHDLDHWLG